MSDDMYKRIERMDEDITALGNGVAGLRQDYKVIRSTQEKRIANLEQRMSNMEEDFQSLCHDLKHHS